jgi:AcrR family transcriptional regulator
MSATDRRELILDAATRAFAHGGYHGTSTDAVAKQAGVSQPYVVRMFGTKLDLFLEVFDRAADRIRRAFEAVLDQREFDPESDEDWAEMSIAYNDLVVDRNFLQVMMHGFSAAGIDEIGTVARRCMGEVFTTVKRTGCTDERARDFIAYGMLINVMLAMRAPEHAGENDALSVLTSCAFGETLELFESPA